jgi:hypothetical protein
MLTSETIQKALKKIVAYIPILGETIPESPKIKLKISLFTI